MALVSATQLTQGKTVFWFLVLPWLYRIGVIVFVARSYPSMSERFAGLPVRYARAGAARGDG